MYDERARPPLLAGNRFLVLVASMVLELCGGSIYVTSLYKIEMRDRWGVSASDMDQLIKCQQRSCSHPRQLYAAPLS